MAHQRRSKRKKSNLQKGRKLKQGTRDRKKKHQRPKRRRGKGRG